MDEEVAALLVRLTARASAALFTASLVSSGAGVLWKRPRLDRERFFFLAFTVSHLLHLIAVFLLAQATGGESIRARGGYLVVIVTGGAVYALIGAIAAFHLGIVRPRRGLAIAGNLVIWLAFAQAYAFRTYESLLFLPLSGGLAIGLVVYLVSLRSRASP